MKSSPSVDWKTVLFVFSTDPDTKRSSVEGFWFMRVRFLNSCRFTIVATNQFSSSSSFHLLHFYLSVMLAFLSGLVLVRLQTSNVLPIRHPFRLWSKCQHHFDWSSKDITHKHTYTFIIYIKIWYYHIYY